MSGAQLGQEAAYPVPIHKADFDTTPHDFVATGCGGLTKREAFAMAAMQGLLSTDSRLQPFTEVAVNARDAADALLEALAKEVV